MATLPITTLTPQSIQQSLQNDGLDTLGLTTLSVSPRWSTNAVGAGDYDATTLALTLSAPRAPFRGILQYAFSPVKTLLAANLDLVATTLSVAAGRGNDFPAPAGGTMLLDLFSVDGSKHEILSCSARSGDSITITRAANDTTAQAFSTGDKLSLHLPHGTRTDAFYNVSGVPVTGPSAIFRLHPQAVLRLETLAGTRFAGAGAAFIPPIPAVMLLHGLQGFRSAQWYEADEVLPGSGGPVTFHDTRGLIIDPAYVAALFLGLQTWLTGLLPRAPASATGAGGVSTIAALSTVTRVQVVDLHGNAFRNAATGATLVSSNGSGTATGNLGDLSTLAPGDGISNAATDAGRLRWGWATNGTLGRTRLVPPTFVNPLAPLFLRVAAVDTVWALLGNRTSATVLGVPPDDQSIPADVLPAVRDQITLTYLSDGPDCLAQAATVMARPNQSMVLAVSPTIDGTMAVPAATGAPAHWPSFPSPNTASAFPVPPVTPGTGITAAWTSGNDVVVTLVAGAAPDGAHVRIYPQQFVVIAAIASDAPSFVRGDGGAAIAHTGAATAILLPNPFQLTSGQPHPATLTVDIVVAPRTGNRRLWAAVSVPISAGPAAAPADSFAGVNAVGAIPPIFQSVAPVPLFGIPTTVPAPAPPPSNNVIAFLRSMASETSPRQGPRLPTMARFETIVATGCTGGSPANTLLWEAVLTGGRWARETRSALHASGNPGNPAGPDLHAPGVHVTGALAYDLARHAMRRAQPIIPLPGATTPGWIVAMDGDNFNPPTDSTATNTGIGVLLETTPAIAETPELSVITPPAPGATVQNLLNNLASSLGVPAPTIGLGNEPRMEQEVHREVIVSASGLRDALWSLRRAVEDARELIYIESPQIARTAYPSTPPKAREIDLVAAIAAVLARTDRPNLHVIVCTPRESDFAQKYRGWSRQHYAARADAVGTLLSAAPDRVAVFHPVGFPGRPAFVRSTTVIVDDVWCLTGATHLRRRGMTFDGSAAIASFDRQITGGYSGKVRAHRRNLMAAKMAIAAPAGTGVSGDWLRLGHPFSAFELVRDWLDQGGLGKIQPLWPGPSDTTVLPATPDMADPDGSDGSTFVTAFASLLNEIGD